MSILFKVKKGSLRNILNKIGPSTELEGLQGESAPMNCEIIWIYYLILQGQIIIYQFQSLLTKTSCI